jgi:hypothetical protein
LLATTLHRLRDAEQWGRREVRMHYRMLELLREEQPGANRGELKFDGLGIARTLADINCSLSMRCHDPPGRGSPSWFGTSRLST